MRSKADETLVIVEAYNLYCNCFERKESHDACVTLPCMIRLKLLCTSFVDLRNFLLKYHFALVLKC